MYMHTHNKARQPAFSLNFVLFNLVLSFFRLKSATDGKQNPPQVFSACHH